MAVKTKRVTKKVIKKVSGKVTSDKVTKKRDLSWVRYTIAIVLGLGLFWYKTHTWPIAAFVNYEPITRFELDQMMYSRVGAEALDALITQRLVSQELRNRKISVTTLEVDAKIEDIKKQLGPDNNFDQILELQNMTLADLKSQIEFQLKLEKLVPASSDSAALQESVANEISSLRTKAKVWMIK